MPGLCLGVFYQRLHSPIQHHYPLHGLVICLGYGSEAPVQEVSQAPQLHVRTSHKPVTRHDNVNINRKSEAETELVWKLFI